MMKTLALVISTISLLAICIGAAPSQDKVKYLPGLRQQPKFNHYSGYLNGTATVKLHYWFVESQGNPSKDPVVLWMNGGPGCSSLDGLLTEHGPFRVHDDLYLTYNEYSWNKIANMIYLESPACVGYSYSTNKNCTASDDTTSLNNYKALLDFFTKFPEFAKNEFYITGESYGGHYVPTLAVRVMANPKINFKGIAVGNGLSSRNLNGNAFLYFAYYHGLVSDSFWNQTLGVCCKGQDHYKCDMVSTAKQSPSCAQLLREIAKLASGDGDINPYNILAKCDKTGVSSRDRTLYYRNRNVAPRPFIPSWLDLPMYTQYGSKLRMEAPPVIPCISSRASRGYLNMPLVRQALHIPSFLPEWVVCNADIDANYIQTYPDMSSQYRKLFTIKNFKILIYNGDIDMMCCYLGDEWFFDSLQIPVIRKRQPWFYSDPEDQTQQVGGFVKEYSKFSLVTVKGAGHMVPADKPLQAFNMFDQFIRQPAGSLFGQ